MPGLTGRAPRSDAIGLALSGLLLLPEVLSVPPVQAATVVGVLCALLLGVLPWIALSAAGLTGLDRTAAESAVDRRRAPGPARRCAPRHGRSGTRVADAGRARSTPARSRRRVARPARLLDRGVHALVCRRRGGRGCPRRARCRGERHHRPRLMGSSPHRRSARGRTRVGESVAGSGPASCRAVTLGGNRV